MIRTALRAPEGPAEVIADGLRLLAVVSIVVAAIGWGPLSGLSFVAAVAVMLIPRLLHVRASFDIAFGLAILFSTWSSVLGIYLTTDGGTSPCTSSPTASARRCSSSCSCGSGCWPTPRHCRIRRCPRPW